MELRQLRYFSVLAETLNFHRAAERLNISQPPLTVAIRKLEAELGVPLFERGARGVRLTAAGRAALEPAREALAQAQRVKDAVTQGGRGELGRLRIGFVGSAISERLPKIISAYRERYPRVELQLEEATSAEIADAIEERKLDAGLVRLPIMRRVGLETQVIEHDHLVVAVGPDHAVARRKSIALAELAELPFIIHGPISILHITIILACQKAGFTPRVAQEATQVQTVLGLVQSGLGVGLVPARMARFAPEGVRLMPLTEPIAVEMGIAWRPNAEPLVRNFVAVACEQGDIQSVSE
ncbi:putative LysR family transcriptional regulator [Caenibius tardaugens NBRC 16725]|uniref:Putative LysR family transcriptional regulator n=1 Tax=Caenibius tardaugens NBRC 16725 TaxID=1219035 RepID=U2Y4A4_9SPHN|nr:LysR substrate-binding domain-containing protein [Caenibius tardaugens]AZI36922.1 LysR family transcriptional regulator [Caenibius tardaugens NBRC 16725]GAD47871.1 putative LysR family transcriptional regulator [Caenibius tardaugens NBRC 16725]